MTCKLCRKEYTTECSYNQGRCPHHPPMVEIPSWRKVIYLTAAPFIIGVWCIMNPRKVWEQAKKDWKL